MDTLRSSNTEPIIRIYAEAATEKEAKDLIIKVKKSSMMQSVSNYIDHTNFTKK